MKPCAHCSAEFEPVRPMQSVCSPKCAAATVKARAVKRKAEARVKQARDKGVRYWTKKAQASFNAYIRARDRQQPCICCGRTTSDHDLVTGSRWDAGHYRSTGSASHLRFNEDNVHRQLVRCNRHGAGRAVDYRLGLIQRIGLARVEALETDNAPRKWTVDELMAIDAQYRAKLKGLL